MDISGKVVKRSGTTGSGVSCCAEHDIIEEFIPGPQWETTSLVITSPATGEPFIATLPPVAQHWEDREIVSYSSCADFAITQRLEASAAHVAQMVAKELPEHGGCFVNTEWRFRDGFEVVIEINVRPGWDDGKGYHEAYRGNPAMLLIRKWDAWRRSN